MLSLLQPGAFISKPFAFPTLGAKIEELMNGKLARSNAGVPADTRSLPLQPEHDSLFSTAPRGCHAREAARLAKNDMATTV